MVWVFGRQRGGFATGIAGVGGPHPRPLSLWEMGESTPDADALFQRDYQVGALAAAAGLRSQRL